jgi:Holliday junction resolvasome RuvABC endonuclease subunit
MPKINPMDDIKILMAIDQASKNSGVTIFDRRENCFHIFSIRCNLDNSGDNITFQIDQIFKLYDKFKPDMVFIEQIAGNKFFSSFRVLTELLGIMKYKFGQMKVEHYLFLACTWKKNIVGSGSAKKPEIMAHFKKYYGIEFKDNNMADSFGICLEGLRQIDADLKIGYTHELLIINTRTAL